MEPGKARAGNILDLMEQKASLKQLIAGIQDGIEKSINGFTEEELEDIDYDTLKKIYDNEKFFMNEAVNERFQKIMDIKRVKKYPQLTKPTYFPEIDLLNISDDEKLRLDKMARKNVKYYMSEDDLKRNEFGLSLEDMELLISIGVAKRRYAFPCPDCGSSWVAISEEDIQLHKRVWELEKRQELSAEESEEFDRLQYDYGCINIECLDCDSSFEITNEEQFKEFEKNIKKGYKIVKAPDLSYEKL